VFYSILLYLLKSKCCSSETRYLPPPRPPGPMSDPFTQPSYPSPLIYAQSPSFVSSTSTSMAFGYREHSQISTPSPSLSPIIPTSSLRAPRVHSESPRLYNPYPSPTLPRVSRSALWDIELPFHESIPPSPSGSNPTIHTPHSSRAATPDIHPFDFDFSENFRNPALSESTAGPNTRLKTRTSRRDTALSTLQSLSKSRITLTDLLGYVVGGQGGFEGYRNALLASSNQVTLVQHLNTMWNDPRGNTVLRDWISPLSLTLVCDTVQTEMENAKPHLYMTSKDAGADFVSNWDITSIMEPVSKGVTPTWSKILEAATESKALQNSLRSNKSRNRVTVRAAIEWVNGLITLVLCLGTPHHKRPSPFSAIACIVQDSDWSWSHGLVFWGIKATHERSSSFLSFNVILQYFIHNHGPR